MSQAAYYNGYDDGYEAAKKEFAKSSQGTESSGAQETEGGSSRAPKIFILTSADHNLDVPSGTTWSNNGSLNAQQMGAEELTSVASSPGVYSIPIPDGGYVAGDILATMNNSGDIVSVEGIDGTVGDAGTLILWYNGTSWRVLTFCGI